MFADGVKTGDRLEIKGNGKTYVSVVEEVTETGDITIHMPIEYGRLVELYKNTVYHAIFFTEKGILRFTAEVSDYDKTDNFNLIRLKILSEGERMQRRSFFRFNCVIPFRFALDGEDSFREGVMKDICGGGIRFVTNIDIPMNKTVKCEMVLNGEALCLQGAVLHRQHFPKSVYAYQYRIEFTGVMMNDREKIVQYVYEEQRRIIKRIK